MLVIHASVATSTRGVEIWSRGASCSSSSRGCINIEVCLALPKVRCVTKHSISFTTLRTRETMDWIWTFFACTFRNSRGVFCAMHARRENIDYRVLSSMVVNLFPFEGIEKRGTRTLVNCKAGEGVAMPRIRCHGHEARKTQINCFCTTFICTRRTRCKGTRI